MRFFYHRVLRKSNRDKRLPNSTGFFTGVFDAYRCRVMYTKQAEKDNKIDSYTPVTTLDLVVLGVYQQVPNQ